MKEVSYKDPYRRFQFYMEGMSIREIARMEGVDYSSVNDSIKASQKKLKKIYERHPSKRPFNSPYSEK